MRTVILNRFFEVKSALDNLLLDCEWRRKKLLHFSVRSNLAKAAILGNVLPEHLLYGGTLTFDVDWITSVRNKYQPSIYYIKWNISNRRTLTIPLHVPLHYIPWAN